jgi:Phosphotransferase enzyme family
MPRNLRPRLLGWWRDNPLDAGRPTLDNPDVRRLINRIDALARATDLGGVMSLNARLEPAGLVLRVHQPFVSRAQLLAVQAVRKQLSQRGLAVGVPLAWQHATVLRCGARLAEMEAYLPHERPKPTLEAYAWLFQAMGTLQRVLAKLRLHVPRPVVATYGPPDTLRRWLPITEDAVRADAEALETAQRLRALVRQLRSQWVPATKLPNQLVHGDMRLGNVCRAPTGETIYFDFGFLARRPRIHDCAYALAYMVLALNGKRSPHKFAWAALPGLIEVYGAASGWRLTPRGRQALTPYTAAVPMYHAAISGFSGDPVRQLRSARPFLQLSEWPLEHPEAILS